MYVCIFVLRQYLVVSYWYATPQFIPHELSLMGDTFSLWAGVQDLVSNFNCHIQKKNQIGKSLLHQPTSWALNPQGLNIYLKEKLSPYDENLELSPQFFVRQYFSNLCQLVIDLQMFIFMSHISCLYIVSLLQSLVISDFSFVLNPC